MSDKTIPCLRLGGNTTWELPTILGTLKWDGKQFTLSPVAEGDKIPDGFYSIIQFKNGLPVKGYVKDNPGYTPPDCSGTAGGCDCDCGGGGGGSGSLPPLSDNSDNLMTPAGDGLLAVGNVNDSADIVHEGNGTSGAPWKFSFANKPKTITLTQGDGIRIDKGQDGQFTISLAQLDPSPATAILGMTFDQYGRMTGSDDSAKKLEDRIATLEAAIKNCVTTDDTNADTTGIAKINLRNSDGALIATDQATIPHAIEDGKDGTITGIKQVD